MDTGHRRRPSAPSTSTPRSQRESPAHFKSLRSPSIGSATPKMEDDDEDGPRRNTRHRNPLPPTSGPLFPPLPPKQPKLSPKAASRSPAVMPSPSSRPASSSTLAAPIEIVPVGLPSDSSALEEDAISARSVSPERPDMPSASNASLTPPPPTSEEANGYGAADQDEQRDEDPEQEGNSWADYKKSRTVRAFQDAPRQEGDGGLEQAGRGVKTEPAEESGAAEEGGVVKEEETPVRSRSTRINPGSASTPVPASAERAGSASRAGRKRRGEDELLLDDHLLPVEIRRTTSVSKRRPSAIEREEEEIVAEPEQVAEAEEPNESPISEVIDVELSDVDDEDGKDITRCVCHKEDIDVMMIQCDECNVWQHGECMGIWGDEEAPDEYFCELCKPERHQPLMKWIRRQGRKSGLFVPPQPHNLESLHNDRDRYPPSQSKRWSESEVEQPPPPPPPSRLHARSHHKKEPNSPVPEAADGRRSTRGRQPAPAATLAGKSEKPISSSRKHDTSAERSRRDSSSPQPHSGLGPRKRSTMNSRDAAYEEAVKAALEASKADASVREEGDIAVLVEDKEKARGEKRRRDEEEDGERDRVTKGKRKKEEDENASAEPAQLGNATGGKAKHPNQYTYRPKPPPSTQIPAAASPARRAVGGSTPVPAAPPAHHDHGTRRAGALAATPIVYHPLTPESANHLSWHLPDHLAAFADLLPAPHPVALEVPAPRTLSYLPRNHFHNQRYGPFTEERSENGRLSLPDEPAGREPVGEPTSQLDPPARPRFPVKRITTAEMKKRIRNMLEYVGRVQIEEGKRQERAKLLGVKVVKKRSNDVDAQGDVTMAENTDPVSETEPGSTPQASKPAQLLDELTRELIAVQESFAVNGFGVASCNGDGLGSPVPPPIPMFNGNGGASSAPPTPVLPFEPTAPLQEVAEGAGDLPPPTNGDGISLDSPVVSMEQTSAPAQATEGLDTLVGAEPVEVGESTIDEGLDVYREGIVKKVLTTEGDVEAAEKVVEMAPVSEEVVGLGVDLAETAAQEVVPGGAEADAA
ncbi:hypothetical protein IAU60_003434 [Kwoniella sp. DSM 27419]